MWSDRETDEDCLGFSSYVESLADVCLEAEIAPLTVGVFGSWGSGKTSLMHMLRGEIDARAKKAADAHEPKIITLWFNAWKYEGKDEIQAALIHAILRELEKDKSLVQDMKDTFDRLKKSASVLKLAKTIAKSAITLTPDFGLLLDAFSDESEKVADTMERFEADFASLFHTGKVARIMVVVDDLDRCSSAKVVGALETIKLFLNTPETTFVIGADAEKIEEAIRSAYGVERDRRQPYSRDYLEKIVQLPFSIPEQGRRDVEGYVAMLVLRGYTKPDGWRALLAARQDILAKGPDVCASFTEWIGRHPSLLLDGAASAATQHLARALGATDVLVRGLRGNPRQIKRFLNILELRSRIASANRLDVSPELLSKMTALEYTWPEFFTQVVETIAPDGTSELMAEVAKLAARKEKPSEESSMLTSALEQPGLAEFVAAPPAVDATTDLSPYLYLAQTALDPKRRSALLPQDEVARDLSERISSDDPIRARAAGRQASKQEATVVSAVVRFVCAKVTTLGGDKQKRARVHALQGLEEICRAAPSHYATVVETLRVADVEDPGFALPAVRVLTAAKDAGLDGAAEVLASYEKRSILKPRQRQLGHGREN